MPSSSHRTGAVAEPSAPDAAHRPIVRRHREPRPRHRLAEAFESLDSVPVLATFRDRLLALLDEEQPAPGAVAGVVESDMALTIRVMREANRVGRAGSVVEAVAMLPPAAIRALAVAAPICGAGEDAVTERMRPHAIATQRAADRLARAAGYEQRDRLVVTALLHDVGKLVLARAYPGHVDLILGDGHTPEDRVRRERRELVVDHALVGGALARRWGLPDAIATAIERHHYENARGDAAFVRLADMLAHFARGDRVSPGSIVTAAGRLGLGVPQLRSLMSDLRLPDPVL